VTLAECQVSFVTISSSRPVTYSPGTLDRRHVTSTKRVMKRPIIYFVTDGRKQLSFFIKRLWREKIPPRVEEVH